MRTIEDAYRVAEGVTRAQARNFYYGIRLLPRDKRSALCAIYALARRIDDIGDGDLPLDQKRAGLAAIRESLEHLGNSLDPVGLAVADAARRFPVPISAFVELIDGVQMDVDGVEYQDFAELVVYCRRVAGSVGRLCLAIFGPVDPATMHFADELGIALQQTNILRDVREDLLNGRVYLPRDELARFGVDLAVDKLGRLEDEDGNLAAMLRSCAVRAEDWYRSGLQLIPCLDRRSAACCMAMSGIYRRLLVEIKASPARVYDRRLSLSGAQKARIAAIALARVAL